MTWSSGSKLLIVALSVIGCQAEAPPPPVVPPPPAQAPPPPSPFAIDPTRLAVYQPLPREATAPDSNPTTDAKVDLGHHLFFEAKLSSSGRESCDACHVVSGNGADSLPLAKGQNGKELLRNTPTVFNAALSGSFGWDGQAASLEEFLKSHLANKDVMGTADAQIAALAKSKKPAYGQLFSGAFPGAQSPVTLDDAVFALAAYIRRLETPSAWDRFLSGDQKALTDEQKKGFNTFADTGCMTCHGGVNVGGVLIQKLGLVIPWPPMKTGDLGRYNATKNDDDRMMFRSAPLRNVARTAPYSVDGSVPAIEEMVKRMAKSQLGRDLSDAEAKSIVAFLSSLNGEPPAELVANPGK